MLAVIGAGIAALFLPFDWFLLSILAVFIYGVARGSSAIRARSHINRLPRLALPPAPENPVFVDQPDTHLLHNLIELYEIATAPMTIPESVRRVGRKSLRRWFWRITAEFEQLDTWPACESLYYFLCHHIHQFIRHSASSSTSTADKQRPVSDAEENRILFQVLQKLHESFQVHPHLRVFSTPSSLLFLWFRDLITFRILKPALRRFTSPKWINERIIQEASSRSLTQRVAIHFRQVLHWSFTSFPPRDYLLHLLDPSYTYQVSCADKWRYAESLVKHVKRCRSVLDAQGVLYSTLVELHQYDFKDRDDATERYYRQLLMIKQKYEKRIRVLIMERESTDMSEAEVARNITTSPPKKFGTPGTDMLDLTSLLTEYHFKRSENLFYFLQFLESRGQGEKVQFWLDAESLRERIYSLDDPLTDSEIRTEVGILHDKYLKSSMTIPSVLHPSTLLAIKQYLTPSNASPNSTTRNFDNKYESVFQAQIEVKRDMETQDFPEFLRSQSYFKWVGHDVQSKVSPVEDLEYESDADLSPDHQQSYPTLDRIGTTGSSREKRVDMLALSDADYEKADLFLSMKRAMKTLVQHPDRLPSSPYFTGGGSQSGDSGTNRGNNLVMQNPPVPRRLQRRVSSTSPAQSWQPVASAATSFTLPRSRDQARFLSPVNPSHDSAGSSNTSHVSAEPLHIPFPSDLPSMPVQAHLDALTQQISLLDYMIKRDRESNHRHHAGVVTYEKVLQRTKDLIRRDMAELVEKKMMSQASDRDVVKWVVSMTPSLAPRDTVFFLDVTLEDSATGVTSSWIVPRRFADFQALHVRLKETYSIVQEFAGKLFQARVNWHKSRSELLLERQLGLLKYLSLLIEHHDVSQSRQLREFLSEQQFGKAPKKEIAKNSDKLNKLLDLEGKPSSSSIGINSGTGASSTSSFSNLFKSPRDPKPVFEIVTSLTNDDTQNLYWKQKYKASSGTLSRSGTLTRAASSTHDHPLINRADESSGDELGHHEPSDLSHYEASDVDHDLHTDDDSARGRVSSSVNDHDLILGSMEEDLEVDTGPGFNGSDTKSNVTVVHLDSMADDEQEGDEKKPDLRRQQQQHAENQEPSYMRYTTLAQPLCEILLSTFEFKEQNPLLREAAALLLLKQGIFGHRRPGSVENHLKNVLKNVFSEPSLVKVVQSIKEWLEENQLRPWTPTDMANSTNNTGGSLDPNHTLFTAPSPLPGQPAPFTFSDSDTAKHAGSASKTDLNSLPIWQAEEDERANMETAHQLRTKLEARTHLFHLLPESFVRILGKDETVEGFRRLFESVQQQAQFKAELYSVLESLAELTRVVSSSTAESGDKEYE